MIKAPTTDNKQPILPIGPSFSFKKIDAKMALFPFELVIHFDLFLLYTVSYPNITLRAPSGVTRIGGANE